MKTVYIPSGESRSYEYLVTDNLIVNGHLNVVNGVKARSISGRGVITAGTVYCDVSTVDEIETTTVVCRCLMARRVSAAEVFASDSAAVSCFLSSAYVETGKLTVALSEIDELKADEVINLCEVKYAADKYEITSDYEERLRNRASLFRNVTRTKKSICHTFITTYGVARNLHSGIVQSEVTMDDLFL